MAQTPYSSHLSRSDNAPDVLDMPAEHHQRKRRHANCHESSPPRAYATETAEQRSSWQHDVTCQDPTQRQPTLYTPRDADDGDYRIAKMQRVSGCNASTLNTPTSSNWDWGTHPTPPASAASISHVQLTLPVRAAASRGHEKSPCASDALNFSDPKRTGHLDFAEALFPEPQRQTPTHTGSSSQTITPTPTLEPDDIGFDDAADVIEQLLLEESAPADPFVYNIDAFPVEQQRSGKAMVEPPSTMNTKHNPARPAQTMTKDYWMPSQLDFLDPFKTFFHTEEMLATKVELYSQQHEIVFDWFARVIHSIRQNFERKQYFQFRDLFKEAGPCLSGALQA